MTQRNDINSPNYHHWLLCLIFGVMVFRLVGMLFSPLGLHGDEAQYWAWSKDLDWGYFTKPPLIAWVIATTTAIFGDAEWAIRLSSPLLHTVTAYVIYRTACVLYDTRTGFWAGALYILMPCLWLSAGIVSTDVPLLLCWALALNGWVHLRETPTWPKAIQFGLAFGFGVLAKYAMLFFLPALVIAFLFDKKTRSGLNNLEGYAAGLIAFLLILPNILWNMNNDFATLSHTAANANIQSGIPFHPDEFLTFWGDQLVMFGPVPLVLLFPAVWAAVKSRLAPGSAWLAGFVISPLLIISIEAIISRANANWAVTGYVAASILVAHWGLSAWDKREKWVKWGVIIQSALGVAFAVIMLSTPLTNALGVANSVKRLRAWPETVIKIEDLYKKGHDGQAFEAIAVDKRIVYYDLNYYGLKKTAPLYMWMRYGHAENHAELSAPLPAMKGPVLLLSYYSPEIKKGRADYSVYFKEDFDRLELLGRFTLDLGGGPTRDYIIWAGYDYTPTKRHK